MKASDIFERIRNHPGVTVRTHVSRERVANRANNAPRHRYEVITSEIIERMREMDRRNVKRLEISATLNICPTAIYYYCGPKKKNNQKWQLRNKRK